MYVRTEPYFVGLANFYNRTLLAVVHRRIAAVIVVAVARTYWRLETSGLNNVPARGPFILAPVHRSIVDTFVDTPMREPRYIRRLAKIRDLEARRI